MTNETTTPAHELPEVSPGLEIEDWVREALRCPATGTHLVEQIGPDGTLELVNTDPERPLAYPVRDGVPVLLIDEARSA